METENQPQQAPVQSEPQVVVQTKQSSGNRTLVTCLALVIILLLCMGLCIGGSVALFGLGFRSAKDSVVSLICNPDDDAIEKVYENSTTENFRNRVSIDQFMAEVKELSGEPCDELRKLSLANLPNYVQNNWSYSATTENGDIRISFSGTIGEKYVTLKTVQETRNSAQLIDEFRVE